MSRIERVITRESGDEVKIEVEAYLRSFGMVYYHSIFRKIGDRFLMLNTDCELKYVTPEEIHSVKMELLESLKPIM